MRREPPVPREPREEPPLPRDAASPRAGARQAEPAGPAPATPAASALPPRASVRERADALLAARGPRARAAGKGGSGGSAASGSAADGSARQPDPRRRRRRMVALGVLGIFAALVAWGLISLFQPGKGEGDGSVAITIPRGSGVGDIGELLADRDVVDSGFLFELRTRLAGKSGDLKPGIYNLRRGMSYGAAIDALTEGPSPNLINVTFPEGIAMRDIGPRVTKAGVKGSYVRAAQRSPLLNPKRYGAADARDLEGFLFPATYQLRRGASARSLVDKQVATFKREFAKVDLKAARRANLTPYDIVIIASLVEREAQLDKERAVVASVIYNRLKAGMNLGIDATVRYAANNWTKPVTRSQLASDSPYNTYRRPGLPPGPIGNPGLASLRAAARPAKTRFLYYVVKPGTCGEHSFAATADEHDRNVAKYEAARQARGGRSPTDC